MTKVAVITGASSGIGKALAAELASRGYDLGLLARRGDALSALAAELRTKHGRKVETEVLDVSHDEEVGPALDRLVERLGGLDVVIANAGITAIHRTGADDFAVEKKVLQTNLVGAMATIDAAVRHFRKKGSGHVVGVSSIAAYRPIPGSGAYSASKAALTSYLDAARRELRKRGITVTAIHPGFIETEITTDMKKYPYLISAEAGAREMADAIEAKKEDVLVPKWPWRFIVPAMKLLPEPIVARLF